VGGEPFSAVGDHTSGLQFIEDVANAGGFSGRQTSELHFPYVSRWRRSMFNNFTKALVSGEPKAAPYNPQFNPSTRAAELASQTASSELPLPPFPGATQAPPAQFG
jgi:phospholipase C